MYTKKDLEQELHQAMRSGDQLRKRLLRRLLSDIKLREVEKREELTEGEILSVIQKAVKVPQETREEALKAGRDDLVKTSDEEIELLQSYLPKPLSEEELKSMAEAAIAEVGATEPRMMGAVMKVLMPRVQGRADGKILSGIVRDLLSE